MGEGMLPVDRQRVRLRDRVRFARERALESLNVRSLHDSMMAGRGPVMPRVRGSDIKVVGKSGQISLGKSYAGKALRVGHRRDGAIILTAVAIVPESQLWTLEEPHRSRIKRGLSWASTTTPVESDVDALVARTPKAVSRAHGRRR